VTSSETAPSYDLRRALAPNRLVGLWRLMTGYHWAYAGATLSLAVAALAKTATLLLLRYLVDHVLGQPAATRTLPLIALATVIVGGVCFSSFLTLFVIPALYQWFPKRIEVA